MKRLFRSCFSAGCAFFASHLLHKIKAPAVLLILFIPWPECRTILRSRNSSPGQIAHLFYLFIYFLSCWIVLMSLSGLALMCVLFLTGQKKKLLYVFLLLWLPCHHMAVVAASCASIAKALPNFSAAS